jgi:hypothetical protein
MLGSVSRRLEMASRRSARGVVGHHGPPSDKGNPPMKLSDFKTNADAANKGRWQKDIPGFGDVELFVRSTNNPDYRRRMQALIRALPPKKRKKGIVDPVEMDRITGICLNDHCLSDWRNVEGDDGEKYPLFERAGDSLSDLSRLGGFPR